MRVINTHVQGVRVQWLTSRVCVPVTDVRAILNPVRVPRDEYPGALFPGTERYEVPPRKESGSRPPARAKSPDPLPGPDKVYPAFYWPGGIPSCVQRYPLVERTREEREEHGLDDFLHGEALVDEARGWLLFVRENWVSREQAGVSEDEDDDYELRQRRDLVERWASAEQAFRDSFHLRAPPRKSATDYPAASLHRIDSRRHKFSRFICLTNPDTPAKRARFIKILILSYQLDGGETLHPFGDEHLPTMVRPNPARFPDQDRSSSGGFSIDDFMMWAFVEPADFTTMTMSRCGRALFAKGMTGYTFIDQNTIDTGRVSMVEFKTNGMVDQRVERLPFNLFQVMTYVNGLGWGLDRIEDSSVGGDERGNGPLDMDLPILDILESGFENDYLSFEGGVETWQEDIERYAPGFLEMEKEGKAAEYDVRNLLET